MRERLNRLIQLKKCVDYGKVRALKIPCPESSMRTIIRYLASACHSLLTLPVLALLLKGYAGLRAHDWAVGSAWLFAGLAGVYLWHFGGRWVLALVRHKTEPSAT
jgi:hypothetical protein